MEGQLRSAVDQLGRGTFPRLSTTGRQQSSAAAHGERGTEAVITSPLPLWSRGRTNDTSSS